MARLILLFTLVPAVELLLLIEVGRRIGSLATVGLILATGVVGAFLARQQGLRVLAQVRADLSRGQVPASSLVDGAIILVAGALLVTPGILTDAAGFLCLVPAFRSLVRVRLRRRFERSLVEGRIHFQGFQDQPGGPTLDADFRPEDATEGRRNDDLDNPPS